MSWRLAVFFEMPARISQDAKYDQGDIPYPIDIPEVPVLSSVLSPFPALRRNLLKRLQTLADAISPLIHLPRPASELLLRSHKKNLFSSGPLLPFDSLSCFLFVRHFFPHA